VDGVMAYFQNEFETFSKFRLVRVRTPSSNDINTGVPRGTWLLTRSIRQITSIDLRSFSLLLVFVLCVRRGSGVSNFS
jgi:hypothetical protein